MSVDFPRIAILGGGLLGGSLALALARLAEPPAVRLWVRRHESLGEASELGIAGATTDLAGALREANLAVLAVPVGAMPQLVSQAIEAGLPAGCLVTDVGSVKCPPHRMLAPLLGERGISFIGSHPMAGSERNGLSAATPGMFEGAACLLTNDNHAPAAFASALERFWKSVGCHTTWMSASIHDELVARISHLPHALAASGAREIHPKAASEAAVCAIPPASPPAAHQCGLRSSSRTVRHSSAHCAKRSPI
jgi:prephenate dehydrogenase